MRQLAKFLKGALSIALLLALSTLALAGGGNVTCPFCGGSSSGSPLTVNNPTLEGTQNVIHYMKVTGFPNPNRPSFEVPHQPYQGPSGLYPSSDVALPLAFKSPAWQSERLNTDFSNFDPSFRTPYWNETEGFTESVLAPWNFQAPLTPSPWTPLSGYTPWMPWSGSAPSWALYH